MILPVGLRFDTPNFGIGRRQICFERIRPVWGNQGVLSVEGVVQFATYHSDACEIARQHERDFRGMIASGETVNVWHDDFPEIDGFYILTEVELPTASPYAFHQLRLELARIGSSNDLRFESVILGTVRDNDYSVSEASSEPMHAPPLGHEGYSPPHASQIVRNVAYEGDMTVYRDIDYDVDPRWSVSARDALRGAATISRREPLYPQYGPIAGETLYDIESVEDIEIGNGIVRFWATENLGVHFEAWDGTSWTDQPLGLGIDLTTPTISRVAILLNTPQRCALKYEYADPDSGMTEIKVTVIRGERGVRFQVNKDVSGTLAASTGVASTVTSNRIVRTTGNPHKVFLATMHTPTFDAATGSLAVTDTSLDFFASVELSGAAAGNTAATLALQYAAAIREDVRELAR